MISAKIDGILFCDGFGRLYFDKCSSSEEHMMAPTPEGEDRRKCRVYLEDVFAPLVGKKGTFQILVIDNQEPVQIPHRKTVIVGSQGGT